MEGSYHKLLKDAINLRDNDTAVSKVSWTTLLHCAIVILSLHVSLCTCCFILVVYVVCKLLCTSILHLHNYRNIKSYPNFAAASNSCTLRTKSGYTHMYTYFVVNCRLTQYHISHFSKHELPVYIF